MPVGDCNAIPNLLHGTADSYLCLHIMLKVIFICCDETEVAPNLAHGDIYRIVIVILTLQCLFVNSKLKVSLLFIVISVM